MSEYVVYLLENGDTVLHHTSRSVGYVLREGIDKILTEGSLMEVIEFLGNQVGPIVAAL